MPSTNLKTAIHESGHTITAWLSPYCLSIDFIQIDPNYGGLTRVRFSTNSVAAQWDYLTVLMGGIAAEIIIFNEADIYCASCDLISVAHILIESPNEIKYSIPVNKLCAVNLPNCPNFIEIANQLDMMEYHSIFKAAFIRSYLSLKMRRKKVIKLAKYIDSNQLIYGYQLIKLLGLRLGGLIPIILSTKRLHEI